MRRESKSPLFFALVVMSGCLLLVSQLKAGATTHGTARSQQGTVSYSSEQSAVALVTVKNAGELALLAASDVTLMYGGTSEKVFIQCTVGKVEELTRQGWPVTLMFVRQAVGQGAWQYVGPPAGVECTYTITPTYKSFTAAGGAGSFDLTTDAACEWLLSNDSSWIHVSGLSQGTGSRTFSFLVDANAGSTNRIGHIFVADQVFTVYEGVNFNDVPPDHPFYREIGILSARGVTVGCGGGNFCPNNPVTREQMAAFIIRSLGEFNPPTPMSQRFADVPPSNVFYNFIDRLAALGITNGCSPTLYCPSSFVLREEAAAFIIRGIGEFNPPTPATQRFADVPPSNPFYNFIDRMAALGITQGCAVNPLRFCPVDTSTRGQTAKFLVKAFNL